MEEDPEHDSKHDPEIQPENLQEVKSSHQIELGSNGEELITKGNLEIAIENMRNGVEEEKVPGKLVAFEGRSPGFYTFKRWVNIGQFMQGPESQKINMPDIVLALLNEDEQRKAFELLHSSPSDRLIHDLNSDKPPVASNSYKEPEEEEDDNRSYIPGKGYV